MVKLNIISIFSIYSTILCSYHMWMNVGSRCPSWVQSKRWLLLTCPWHFKDKLSALTLGSSWVHTSSWRSERCLYILDKLRTFSSPPCCVSAWGLFTSKLSLIHIWLAFCWQAWGNKCLLSTTTLHGCLTRKMATVYDCDLWQTCLWMTDMTYLYLFPDQKSDSKL